MPRDDRFPRTLRSGTPQDRTPTWTIIGGVVGILGLLVTVLSLLLGSGGSAPAANPVSSGGPSTPVASPSSTSIESTTPADVQAETTGTDPGSSTASNTVPDDSPGPLHLAIELDGTPIDIKTYATPYQVGWTSRVFDTTGDLDGDCFATWTLYKNGENIYMSKYPCQLDIYPHQNYGPGKYKLVGRIRTTDGRTTEGSASFIVITNG